jgi:hypothetical protein
MIKKIVINSIYEQICLLLKDKYFKYPNQNWVMTLDRIKTNNICIIDFNLDKSLNTLPFVVTMYNKGYNVHPYIKKEIVLLNEIYSDWDECSEEIFNKIKNETENLLK